MKIFNKEISFEFLFRLLFHILFWSIWFLLPIINALDNNTDRDQFYLKHIAPLHLLHIPLFILNIGILIPYVLKKGKMTQYILSVIGLTIVFITFHYWLKTVFWPADRVNTIFDIRSATPLMFVAAVSTVYGLIIYLADQEKIKKEEKQEKLQSELSFLRSQISPHFIFNVLNSIVYLTRTKADAAEAVTIKLSELMRYMLYESDEAQVSLAKEMDYLNNYIELQKVRFGEDISIDFKTKGTIKNQMIEPMLLIPFVENAFKHGVGLITEPTIKVFTETTDTELIFEVQNKITTESKSEKDETSGIGLKNVMRRLELLYQDKYTLKTTIENNWYTTNLKIKYRA